MHSALRNPAFPCPKRRRFQVAIAAFGPFWEKIGRPWLNSTRRLLARRRLRLAPVAFF